MNKRIRLLIVLACACVLNAPSVRADVPHLVNYQGLLTDAQGARVSGAHQLTFSIYPDTAAATPALWTEQQPGILVTDGVFNVFLGSATPLPDDLFQTGERWLGVAVDSDPEMSPRILIGAVPWALHAAIADSVLHAPGGGLGGGGTADYLAKFTSPGAVGNSAIVETNGMVGIGTSNPWVNLQIGDYGGMEKKSVAVGGHVDRNYTGDTPDTPQFMTYGASDTRFGVGHSWGALSLVAFDMDTYGAGNVQVFTGNRAQGWPAAERLRVTANGRVGIGTTSPGQLLEVAGTARVTGFEMPTGAATGAVLTSDAAGVASWQPAGAPSGAAGGDLTGTYPDPDIASGAVGESELADEAVTGAKIADGTVTGSDVSPSAALGIASLATTGDVTIAGKVTVGTVVTGTVSVTSGTPVGITLCTQSTSEDPALWVVNAFPTTDAAYSTTGTCSLVIVDGGSNLYSTRLIITHATNPATTVTYKYYAMRLR